MEDTPDREFGRRQPVVSDFVPPVKRSRHVALLLMGTFAVGGGAFAMMPRTNCEPPAAGTTAPPAGASCTPRGPSGGGHNGWIGSHGYFFGGDPASSRAPSGTASESAGTTRGGFGAFARSFAAHFSGGS
jgi:hypothetical protein